MSHSKFTTFTKLQKPLRLMTVVAMVFGMFAPLAQTTTSTFAAEVTAVSLKGGTGTYTTADGTIYAKSGASLTLEVRTDETTKCVELTGAHPATQTSSTAKTSWSFPLSAGTGEGTQTLSINATAYRNFNPHGKCVANQNETLGTQTVSYVFDNSGPVVTAAVSPAANADGWNNKNVTINWSATDGNGSGVASGPTPASDNVTDDTAGVNKTATATDRLGNQGSGSVTIKLDKTAPTITGSRSPAANAAGWNNSDVTVSFITGDALSGVATNPGSKVLGEGANQSHSGTVTDVAGNSASATVSGINIDKTAPTLTGAPTTQPNTNGWYNGDVTVAWTARDALSGPAATPANSTIRGEGENLKATQTVSDNAGNSTTADSPLVKIDRTAPTTGISGISNDWRNGDVTVSLSPSDSLSGIASTTYSVDGGAAQTGTSFTLSAEGDHTVTYWSTDNAGNAEAAKTARVKIDRTAPTIRHQFTPSTYSDGAWTNGNVTVTFICEDQGGSGVASCTDPVTKSAEGRGQQVTGTATDAAGNSATDTATVNIDKTAPTITASRDRAANAADWYNDDVTVKFTCADALSGIASCTAPQKLGQGAAQSVSGTATDAAGNSASATESGINIDKTAPSLSGTPSTTGWSRGDVTVTWSASDSLSGLAGPVPAPSTVTGEGDNLSASASVSDKAGNTTNATVSGIKIDRTAPSTSASVPAALESGWYAGDVLVTLNTGSDLSGIDKTYYQVGDGEPQLYSEPFKFGTKGISTITFWSVDVAGNVEDKNSAGHTITLKIDGTAPVTAISLPANFDNTWVASVAPVAFSVKEEESGVKGTYYRINDGEEQLYDPTKPLMIETPGSYVIKYWSVDRVGNVEAERTYTVKFDDAAPTITAKVFDKKGVERSPNTTYWFNDDVTVRFTCDDPLSGLADIAGCSDPETLANEGAGQKSTGIAVDKVGNTASTTVENINIDKTKPTLSGAPTTNANSANWYRGDVTIKWTGQDALSGIDPDTQPANSTITGEGSSLKAGPVAIADKAGNVSLETYSPEVNIDRTAPTISGKTVNDDGSARSANSAGWFNSAVRVRFTATDSLSGIADQPTDVVLDKDGKDQIASQTTNDKADNSASAEVKGISIDSKAPTSKADIVCEGKNNFCRGAKATINLSAADQSGLSGVKELRYSTDGGKTWPTVAGSTGSFDITLNRSGKVTVQFRAVDNAGNEETINTIEVKYDTVAPTVSHKLDPQANAAGWNKANTTVTFSAVDDSDGSGVDAATLTAPVTVATETAGQLVTGEAYDLAGNKGTDSVTVKLDKTAPTINGAATTSPNVNGWYNSSVTVKFTCADALSGIAECTAEQALTENKANQSVTGTAEDKANNTASTTVDGINIDAVKPTIDSITVANDATYILGNVPVAACQATDNLSGLDGACSVIVTAPTGNGVGTYSFTATAKDKAGNTETVTGTYKVIYNIQYGTAFFLQPINDTAHTTGLTTSIFKAGSTVPVKFQLKDANGNVVQANSAPEWLTPAKGSATSEPMSETAYSDPATSGSTYRWDGQQYIYNWGSPKNGNGYYWRVGVKLDDGRMYAVNIGLR